MNTDMQGGLRIVTGHYGSGKTEFAVNLAIALCDEGRHVTIADMDIVNPYFCTRERKAMLEERGIRVILPSAVGTDLPSIPAEILSMFQRDRCGIIDLGGDPVGARALARFQPELEGLPFELLCVINANRSETATAAKAAEYVSAISKAAGVGVTGLVANTHLCGATEADDIRRGDRLVRELSGLMGLPVRFTAVEHRLAAQLGFSPAGILLPVKIYMKKPWE